MQRATAVQPLQLLTTQATPPPPKSVCTGHAWGAACVILPIMLFMVIERFKGGDARSVGERFRHSGRMLPEGVAYHAI